MLGCKHPAAESLDALSYMEPHNVVIPQSIDWRKHGYVTEDCIANSHEQPRRKHVKNIM